MKPSSSELVVLKVLWREGNLSAGELHAAVTDDLQWSRSSTRKTLERMVQKGMVSIKDMHGLNVYQAKVKKVPTLAKMVHQFAADVLGLDGPLPVSNLVKSDLLSPDELQELEALLEAEIEKSKSEGR